LKIDRIKISTLKYIIGSGNYRS